MDKSRIILDADTILSLFKMDTDASQCLLSFLEDRNVKNKLWIPYEVAWKYHKRMNMEILCQIENINNTLTHLTQCKESIEAIRQHPYLTDKTTEKFVDVTKLIEKECNKWKEELSNSLIESDIKTRVRRLFTKGLIGSPYSEGELEKIYEEGAKRYETHTPPGYETSDVYDNRVHYHDLIVWKQILAFADEEVRKGTKLFLLVTGTIKNDWYYIVSNKIISTHQELKNEFHSLTRINNNTSKQEPLFDCCTLKKLISILRKKYSIINCNITALERQVEERVEYATTSQKESFEHTIV